PYPPLTQVRPGLAASVAAAVDRLMAKVLAERPADAQEARALLTLAVQQAGGGSDLGAPTVRPGAMPSLPATLPSATPLPSVEPVPAAATTPRPALRSPLLAPPPPSGAATPAAPRPKRSFFQYALIGFALFVMWQGCRTCQDCARSLRSAAEESAADELRGKREQRRQENGREERREANQAGEAAKIAEPVEEGSSAEAREAEDGRLSDAGAQGVHLSFDGKDGPPDFQKLGEEIGKKMDEALRKADADRKPGDRRKR
ncbi:MAG: hypothetical protein HY901_14325, partial [Deltaproteobacteria bacterium]|nr:hypothetical protein [Deltaproteobacteria bacterium]